MKITKKQLQEMVRKAVIKTLKEHDHKTKRKLLPEEYYEDTQPMTQPVGSEKETSFTHAGKIPLEQIKQRADAIRSRHIISTIESIVMVPQEKWDEYLGSRAAAPYKIAFRDWTKNDLLALNYFLQIREE